jgi:hypothetical protein
VIKAMATYKTIQDSSLSLGYSRVKCDICDSEDIVDTSEGYVCRECGVVLSIQKFQYDRPYNEELIQYAIGLGKTQIGTKRERGFSPHSGRLHRLNRQNLIIPNEDAVNERAKTEISNTFSRLKLTDYKPIKEMVFDKFKEIRPQLRKGVKYRNTEKLVSIISYFCLKLRNVSINAYDLIDASEITKKEFNDFCYQVRRYMPEYAERNRKDYILQRVFDVSEYFELGMEFYHFAEKILNKLWHGIKSTTDNVVAGLLSSISLIGSKIEEVTVSAICNRLGIRMSTIQAQVKKKIFKRFKVEGFVSLIKSSDLLIKIIEKLGLLDPPKVDVEDIPQEITVSNDHVELVLGNATEVFNAREFDYYYFAVRSDKNTPIIISMKIYDYPLDSDYESYTSLKENNLLDFELFSYYNYKGPPSLCKS